VPVSQRYRCFILILLIATLIGCQSLRRASTTCDVAASSRQISGLAAAECAYAQAIKSEKQCDAMCVDYFFQAATLAWPDVERQVFKCGKPSGRATEIYRASLCKLIYNGQHYCRFDPSRGLDLQTESGQITIPIAYQGFPWRPDEFDQLVTVNQTSSKDLNTWYRCDGLGVATIAFHNRRSCERFRREQQAFAATVVLRPVADANGATSRFEFVFADPLRVSSLSIGGANVAIERNPTAPIAYRVAQKDKQYIQEFLHPGGTTENLGLFLLEPYQPGKIPILFVHGLLSDPFTWANAANELRARPDLMERYQIWGFEYATGEPFLKSAAFLRQQLQEAHAQLDPTGSDSALSQMVLVGHSMGGLVSKLQVTHSGTELWNAVSCRPLEELTTTPESYRELASSFYFEPSPWISRVVFLGTPHRGSPWARRPVGRYGAKLVEEPSSMEEMHQQLVHDNPGVFSREFTRRIPTSIDLLRADSALLQSMNRLPLDGRVQLHSIIGSGYWMLGGGKSDRVVPVSSAQIPLVTSEKFVHAKHTHINGNPDAIEELFCILRRHLQENGPVIQPIQVETVNFSD
jgi:pimeloyl-ACP methyl ester carboxylesterase